MLFNSSVFVIFFLFVYASYLLLHRRFRVQNALLVVASYVFYGYWDWRFLTLIAISTGGDFWVGLLLNRTHGQKRRKLLLALSVCANLGMLGIFKYFGFFSESFARLIQLIGLRASPVTLHVVLPVGISFYTFQTMSYTIDIYRRRIKPTRNLLDFALFVAFFPQLVAGPIERASNLLPQMAKPRRITWEQVNAGLCLLLWGYFKKVVVADNVGMIADQVFGQYAQYGGLDIVFGTLAFATQIYCDFSGYSDIARGLARLMGFELVVNFKLPYFALNPTDFWRRWHVSLSSWLRDYLYIPLGGNRRGKLMVLRNLALTMLLGGLWHGAGWNYVAWGAYHAVILIAYRIVERNPEHEDPWGGQYPYWRVLAKMVLMFILTCIGWVIFRSTSLSQAWHMLRVAGLHWSPHSAAFGFELLFFCFPVVVVDLCQYISRDLLFLTKRAYWIRVPAYAFMFVWITVFGIRESLEFIYFQF